MVHSGLHPQSMGKFVQTAENVVSSEKLLFGLSRFVCLQHELLVLA
jgi:hypothetical protein